jgi:CO/xanthine dehydrogenase Mo-binding subunit
VSIKSNITGTTMLRGAGWTRVCDRADGAVVANAADDAVGARVFQLPITRERLKKALTRE